MTDPFSAPIGDFDENAFSIPEQPTPPIPPMPGLEESGRQIEDVLRAAGLDAEVIPVGSIGPEGMQSAASMLPPFLKNMALEKANFFGRFLVHMIDGQEDILQLLADLLARKAAEHPDRLQPIPVEELREQISMTHTVLHLLNPDG